MSTATRALRLGFAGTPDFAARHLQALLDDGRHQLAAVYTQPDRPAKRGRKAQASPVKQLALEHDLPVYQPPTLRDASAQAELARLGLDLLVVVAYGLLLPPPVLTAPRLGCINVHASLLPRWRGAAPIERAIEAGDAQSGVTIMQMDAGLDTGAMLLKAPCAITPQDNAASLYTKLLETGPPALLQALAEIAGGSATPVAQDEAAACYAAKIDKTELALDWREPCEVLDRRIRAFHLRGPHTTVRGERLKVLRAHPLPDAGADAAPGTVLSAERSGIAVACGSGTLVLEELQLPGARALPVADMLNARADWFAPGTRLGAN